MPTCHRYPTHLPSLHPAPSLSAVTPFICSPVITTPPTLHPSTVIRPSSPDSSIIRSFSFLSFIHPPTLFLLPFVVYPSFPLVHPGGTAPPSGEWVHPGSVDLCVSTRAGLTRSRQEPPATRACVLGLLCAAVSGPCPVRPDLGAGLPALKQVSTSADPPPSGRETPGRGGAGWGGGPTCGRPVSTLQPEVPGSGLLGLSWQNVALLEDEADINQLTEFFSYEHFYVIYCKFWELDTDHDLLIDAQDLAQHSDHGEGGAGGQRGRSTGRTGTGADAGHGTGRTGTGADVGHGTGCTGNGADTGHGTGRTGTGADTGHGTGHTGTGADTGHGTGRMGVGADTGQHGTRGDRDTQVLLLVEALSGGRGAPVLSRGSGCPTQAASVRPSPRSPRPPPLHLSSSVSGPPHPSFHARSPDEPRRGPVWVPP